MEDGDPHAGISRIHKVTTISEPARGGEYYRKVNGETAFPNGLPNQKNATQNNTPSGANSKTLRLPTVIDFPKGAGGN